MTMLALRLGIPLYTLCACLLTGPAHTSSELEVKADASIEAVSRLTQVSPHRTDAPFRQTRRLESMNEGV